MKTMFFLGAKEGQDAAQWEDEYLHAHADGLCAVDAVKKLTLNVLRDPTPEMVDAGWGWGGAEDTGILGIDEVWTDGLSDDEVLGLYEGENIVMACVIDENYVFSCREPQMPRGQKSPWIKRLGLLRKRSDMTYEQFVDYWANVHGPKATRIHRGAVRYDQNRFAKVLSIKEGFGPWNGSMSLYYFSIDAFRYAHFSYEGAQQEIAEDVANFQDKFLALPYGEEYVMKR